MEKREIKFRAWNKVQDKMFTVEGLDFTYTPPAILKLDHDMPGIKVVDYWLHDEDFILMQFTGLKDKNRKEIWEGDLIVYAGRRSDPRAVEYWENGFYEAGFLHNQIEEDALVVGNIYENPELLGKDK